LGPTTDAKESSGEVASAADLFFHCIALPQDLAQRNQGRARNLAVAKANSIVCVESAAVTVTHRPELSLWLRANAGIPISRR
jgi:hypothetical protein